MAEGKLSLSPMFPAPYTTPLLISDCEGSVSQAHANGKHHLSTWALLSICSLAFPGAETFADSVSLQCNAMQCN